MLLRKLRGRHENLQEFVGLSSFLCTASEGWDEGHELNYATYSPGIFFISPFFFSLNHHHALVFMALVGPLPFLVNFIYL